VKLFRKGLCIGIVLGLFIWYVPGLTYAMLMEGDGSLWDYYEPFSYTEPESTDQFSSEDDYSSTSLTAGWNAQYTWNLQPFGGSSSSGTSVTTVADDYMDIMSATSDIWDVWDSWEVSSGSYGDLDFFEDLSGSLGIVQEKIYNPSNNTLVINTWECMSEITSSITSDSDLKVPDNIVGVEDYTGLVKDDWVLTKQQVIEDIIAVDIEEAGDADGKIDDLTLVHNDSEEATETTLHFDVEGDIFTDGEGEELVKFDEAYKLKYEITDGKVTVELLGIKIPEEEVGSEVQERFDNFTSQLDMVQGTTDMTADELEDYCNDEENKVTITVEDFFWVSDEVQGEELVQMQISDIFGNEKTLYLNTDGDIVLEVTGSYGLEFGNKVTNDDAGEVTVDIVGGDLFGYNINPDSSEVVFKITDDGMQYQSTQAEFITEDENAKYRKIKITGEGFYEDGQINGYRETTELYYSETEKDIFSQNYEKFSEGGWGITQEVEIFDGADSFEESNHAVKKTYSYEDKDGNGYKDFRTIEQKVIINGEEITAAAYERIANDENGLREFNKGIVEVSGGKIDRIGEDKYIVVPANGENKDTWVEEDRNSIKDSGATGEQGVIEMTRATIQLAQQYLMSIFSDMTGEEAAEIIEAFRLGESDLERLADAKETLRTRLLKLEGITEDNVDGYVEQVYNEIRGILSGEAGTGTQDAGAGAGGEGYAGGGGQAGGSRPGPGGGGPSGDGKLSPAKAAERLETLVEREHDFEFAAGKDLEERLADAGASSHVDKINELTKKDAQVAYLKRAGLSNGKIDKLLDKDNLDNLNSIETRDGKISYLMELLGISRTMAIFILDNVINNDNIIEDATREYLKDKGLNGEEIDAFLENKDEEFLKSRGLTDEEIDVVMNMDETEAMSYYLENNREFSEEQLGQIEEVFGSGILTPDEEKETFLKELGYAEEQVDAILDDMPNSAEYAQVNYLVENVGMSKWLAEYIVAPNEAEGSITQMNGAIKEAFQGICEQESLSLTYDEMDKVADAVWNAILNGVETDIGKIWISPDSSEEHIHKFLREILINLEFLEEVEQV